MKKRFVFYTLWFSLFLINGAPVANTHKMQAVSNVLDGTSKHDLAPSPIPDYDDNDNLSGDDGAEEDESDPMHDAPEIDGMDAGTPRAHES